MLYEKNVKKIKGMNGLVKCKCGSIRYVVSIGKDDDGDFTWITITCKKCGAWLFYNGA